MEWLPFDFFADGHRHLWSGWTKCSKNYIALYRAQRSFSLYLLRHRHHVPLLERCIRWKFNIFCHFSYLFLLLLYNCKMFAVPTMVWASSPLSLKFCMTFNQTWSPAFYSWDEFITQGTHTFTNGHYFSCFASALLSARTKPPTVCSFSSTF